MSIKGALRCLNPTWVYSTSFQAFRPIKVCNWSVSARRQGDHSSYPINSDSKNRWRKSNKLASCPKHLLWMISSIDRYDTCMISDYFYLVEIRNSDTIQYSAYLTDNLTIPYLHSSVCGTMFAIHPLFSSKGYHNE